MGLSVPSVVRQTGEVAVSVGTEAVFAASIISTQGQQIVATGTLTQGTNGNFTYVASPSDRLRISWSNGASTDFFITQLQGDFSRDATHYVNSDHALSIRMTEGDSVDVTVQSSRLNGQWSASLEGFITLNDVKYTADLSQSGTYSSSVDSSYIEYVSSDAMRGTISSTEGFSADVDESNQFKFAMFDNGVTNETRTVNNRWTADGHDYAISNAMVRFETLNGWANPSDYWVVQGTVLRDGEAYGQLELEVTEAWIAIFLVVGSERLEVERFLRYQEGG